MTHFGYSRFPLWDTEPSIPSPFGVLNDKGDEEFEYEDVMDGLAGIGEELEILVTQLAKKCPKLESVSIAGPRGYEVADYFFAF